MTRPEGESSYEPRFEVRAHDQRPNGRQLEINGIWLRQKRPEVTFARATTVNGA